MMVCKICSHPERAAIDKAIIVDQRSLRDVSGQYEVSRSALDRHKRHIPKALTKAKQAETVAESTSLLSRVEKLMAKCESICEKATAAGKWAGAAMAAKEIRSCLELLGKISGELQPNGARVAINFGDITNIDINALTDEQLRILYGRLIGEADAESGIDSDLFAVREAVLFDEITVPPGPGYETNMRHDPKKAWRNASRKDRFRMLAAAWKRETGKDLTETLEDLTPRAVMEIEFDLAEERNWMAWPMVRLKRPADALQAQ